MDVRNSEIIDWTVPVADIFKDACCLVRGQRVTRLPHGMIVQERL